jgi:transcriptional regulator
VQRPAAGYPVNEVLTLYENGVTLPQIARTLNMSKSEIELIVKIYGEGINMRKIV